LENTGPTVTNNPLENTGPTVTNNPLGGNPAPYVEQNIDKLNEILTQTLINNQQAQQQQQQGSIIGTVPPISTIPPFIANPTIISTSFFSERPSSIRNMANININCNNHANIINGFEYSSNGEGSANFIYNCSTGGNLGGNVIKSNTDSSAVSSTESIKDLSTQKVACDNNGAMGLLKGFSLKYNNSGGTTAATINYEKECDFSNKDLKCRTIQTQKTPLYSGLLGSLGNHPMKCLPDEGLSGFQLNTSGEMMNYSYSCCKI
jgi:hypothetical protein